MRTFWVFLLFAFVSLTLAPSLQSQGIEHAAPTGFRVAAAMPMSRDANGVAGQLELILDSRITPAMLKDKWQTGELDTDPKGVFKTSPPRNAELRLVRSDGDVVYSKLLERPLASLESSHLYADVRFTYLLTVDYSAGFGSYSGPITSLWEVSNGTPRRLEATDPVSGKGGEISLMTSLKTAWRIVPAKSGNGKDILLALCRPDRAVKLGGYQNFETNYVRYSFNGVRWVGLIRTVKRLSEFDEFPSRRLFP